MSMTPDAKSALSRTIRALRERLLADLHAAVASSYQMQLSADRARLSPRMAILRQRLEAWIAEQIRATGGKNTPAIRARLREDVEKEAAYTLLNRLIVVKLLEGAGLVKPAVVTGGWESPAYRELAEFAPGLLDDETQGYAFLLDRLFDELALDLPGLFGPVGLTALVPIPPATLRAAVEALNDPELSSCWTDDMTLGWVYQYFNDPEREALDAKLNAGGKIAAHEIASKTQMFTERYMVDWLLQNSLGPMWIAMCRRHGWTPACESTGTLARLEARRVDWRAQREAGEVSLTALMPLHTDLERQWAYYTPQPIPDDAVAQAPDSVRDLKILDPAVGSGHFLIVAFDLLFSLYREEAGHRGEDWSAASIVESILANNLHGIDLDPRAVQIAAAALWLKARQAAPDARPRRVNLVASKLRLAGLDRDDPALVTLREGVERETGIPGALTDAVVEAIKGADHLGSLLKIGAAVDAALGRHEAALTAPGAASQGDLFGGYAPSERVSIDREAAKRTILDRLERFLAAHTTGDDLGLRLRGEQLAAGVRFVRMAREEQYDLVVGNPPYQGTSKLADGKIVAQHYPEGKADLYAAFLMRGLQLVRPGGTSALLTMRNWMFIKQYAALRELLLGQFRFLALGDLDWGSFSEMKDVKAAISVFQRSHPTHSTKVVAPTGTSPSGRTHDDYLKKISGFLVHNEAYTFTPTALKVVPEWPLVYWWERTLLEEYKNTDLIGTAAPAAKGICTCNDTRYLRPTWNMPRTSRQVWVPSVHGGKGKVWMDPCDQVLNWGNSGLEIKTDQEHSYNSISKHVRSPHYYFRRGVAFSMIGSGFSARVHRYPSIFGNMGSSVFPDDLASAVCAMNSTRAREILQSLNPGVHFEVGDVNRLPLFPIANADDIFATIEAAFTIHESHREASVEFTHPGPSPWDHAQVWAQEAVDRPEGAPLPAYTEQLVPAQPVDHVSYAIGVAMGRFGASREGILDPATADLTDTLPHGMLYLSAATGKDSLTTAPAAGILKAWATHGPAIDPKASLRKWLRTSFFKDDHLKRYENRPIYFPLSSDKRSFVAYVSIHRWTADTLRTLLATWLNPERVVLTGRRADLLKAREGASGDALSTIEKQLTTADRHLRELGDFIDALTQCAERGPLPPDTKTPAREVDARYAPVLDDGVMINAAALYPLLSPQWSKPLAWWRELASAKGRKDYDWSQLARRYWPSRVEGKCVADPSLGVAHGCFWRLHPARAWAWELRLQQEIGPDFVIDEPDAAEHRAAFLEAQPQEALDAIDKEAQRRKRKDLPVDVRHPVARLWHYHPEAVAKLEAALSAKLGARWRYDEPGSDAARKAQSPDAPDAQDGPVQGGPRQGGPRQGGLFN